MTKKRVKCLFAAIGVVVWAAWVVAAVWVLCSPPGGPGGNLSFWQVCVVVPGVGLGAIGIAAFAVWVFEVVIPAIVSWYDRLPDK